MNILILHSHPESRSFSSTLKDVAVNHFSQQGHRVVLKDLYAMGFNPVGSPNDFKQLSNPHYFNYMKEQMNAFLTNNYEDDLLEEMNALQEAEFLLLNFPLWWTSFPAILKGWFDRVFSFGFAYNPKDKKYSSGAFVGKKAMCCITCGASQEAYSENGEHGDLIKLLDHIHHQLLFYTGMTVLPPFIAYRAHLSDENTLKSYIEKYREHLNNIDNLNPIYKPNIK